MLEVLPEGGGDEEEEEEEGGLPFWRGGEEDTLGLG